MSAGEGRASPPSTVSLQRVDRPLCARISGSLKIATADQRRSPPRVRVLASSLDQPPRAGHQARGRSSRTAPCAAEACLSLTLQQRLVANDPERTRGETSAAGQVPHARVEIDRRSARSGSSPALACLVAPRAQGGPRWPIASRAACANAHVLARRPASSGASQGLRSRALRKLPARQRDLPEDSTRAPRCEDSPREAQGCAAAPRACA